MVLQALCLLRANLALDSPIIITMDLTSKITSVKITSEGVDTIHLTEEEGEAVEEDVEEEVLAIATITIDMVIGGSPTIEDSQTTEGSLIIEVTPTIEDSKIIEAKAVGSTKGTTMTSGTASATSLHQFTMPPQYKHLLSPHSLKKNLTSQVRWVRSKSSPKLVSVGHQ